METQKIEGIVLSVSKYKEADVLATILTKNGQKKVKFVGVRRAKSKFGFAAQPFCHAEFLLSSSKDYAVVMGVDQKSDFFGLATDYDKFELASKFLMAVKNVTFENQDSSDIFDLLLMNLSLVLAGVKPELVSCIFFARLLCCLGVFVPNGKCAHCGKQLSTGALIDETTCATYCTNCGDPSFKSCSKNVLELICSSATSPVSEIVSKNLSDGELAQASEFLSKMFENQK